MLFSEVDEKGTEAAAATGIRMTLLSALPDRTPVFRADRPFLFFIRHNPSNAILFVGRISDPTVPKNWKICVTYTLFGFLGLRYSVQPL